MICPPKFRDHVQELQQMTADISSRVHALSHELHPSTLDSLGLAKGVRSWCKEFGERQGMEIDFSSDVRSPLPSEIGLSLFRVLQEALQNAAKHSGVRQVEVKLAEQSNEVHLAVIDSGRGFDIEAAKQGRGLGLTSMQERIRLVNGTITIESKPMGGTTIYVRVPLESRQAHQGAAR
jgi:signal transduction histidine kinase